MERENKIRVSSAYWSRRWGGKGRVKAELLEPDHKGCGIPPTMAEGGPMSTLHMYPLRSYYQFHKQPQENIYSWQSALTVSLLAKTHLPTQAVWCTGTSCPFSPSSTLIRRDGQRPLPNDWWVSDRSALAALWQNWQNPTGLSLLSPRLCHEAGTDFTFGTLLGGGPQLRSLSGYH